MAAPIQKADSNQERIAKLLPADLTAAFLSAKALQAGFEMRRSIVAALFLNLFAYNVCWAQKQDDAAAIDTLSTMTKRAIADIIVRLPPLLDTDERQIFDQIRFVIDPTLQFNGRAWKDGEIRTVGVSAGVSFLMNVLAQSMAVGFRGNVPCMQAHALRSIKDTIEGMSDRSQARRVWSINAFSTMEPICAGADKLIANDQQMAHAIGATTKIGLDLVILHEIAHQILGHVEDQSSDPPTEDELRTSRFNEDEADRWAIKMTIRLKEPLMLATPYLLIMAATTPNKITLEGERSLTHPSGIRRALVILDRMEKDFKEQDITLDAEMTKSLNETRKELRTRLPN